MSSSADNGIRERRPHDSDASRAALLTAAGELFRERGYERATTREIGERAGVDPALIARYFGSKERLFVTAIATLQMEDAALESPQAFVGRLLEYWEERGHNPVSRALASPELSPQVRDQVAAVVADLLSRPEAERLREHGAPEPQLRAELLIALAVGVAMTRANGALGELAAAPRERVLDLLAPAIDALGGA